MQPMIFDFIKISVHNKMAFCKICYWLVHILVLLLKNRLFHLLKVATF